jgi:ethanolamine transporter
MNVRGKVVMAAFAASMSNALGAHLGFVSATEQRYILPMFLAKLVAGVLAVAVAYFLAGRLFARELAAEQPAQISAESVCEANP